VASFRLWKALAELESAALQMEARLISSWMPYRGTKVLGGSAKPAPHPP
jgi:hypothetical protein